MNILLVISRWLARYTSAFIILIAVVSFFLPETFAWVQQGQRASIILGLIMLTMGCTLSTEDFRILLSRPIDILIGSIAQYTIMPLVAYTLARLFHLDSFMAAGIILVGCCPGGVSSNIMSFLCKGDVAYSVGMTTVSTVLSPFVTPLLVLWLAGAEIDVDAWGMFQNILLVTLLPVTLGVAFNYFLGKRKDFQQIQGIMPGISVLCLACIVGGVIFTVHPQLQANGLKLILLTLAVVTLHNGTGYLLGYLVGKAFGFNTAKRRTLSIEVGMQNAGMATVLARNFFASPAIIAMNPMAALAVIPCAISCAYHSISGTLLAGYFSWQDEREKSKTMKKFALTLVLMFALTNFTKANDGVYYTSGSFLVPLKDTDISVKKEVLEITLCKDSFATVSVNYTLYNNSKDKRVTMAFEAAAPYNAWAPFSREGKHPFIQDFTVLFNGQELQHHNGIIASQYDKETDFAPLDMTQWKGYSEVPDSEVPMDDVLVNPAMPDSFCTFAYAYYFDAPFKQGENTVRHTYRYKMSYGVGRKFEVPYSLAPASRWANGKVDDFTLRITSDDTRAILLPDSLFLGAPFRHSRGERHTYQIQYGYYGECLFAELMKGDVLEWHSKDFAPRDGMCIRSATDMREGVGEYATAGKVVVTNDGYEGYYLADSGDSYFVETQEYDLVPKSEARVELREAKNGQGFVYLKSDIRKANVRKGPSKQSQMLFTLDNPEDEVLEGYPCLGLEYDKSDYNIWYKVSINGKTGYISSRIALWDSISL
jgi:BASS family bile acid:Na+ symporter